MDKNYDKEERINGTPCGGNEMPRGFEDLPLLRYLKEPAYNLGELYVRYPDGGEDGWFCLLPRKGQIAFWDPVAKKWSRIGTNSSGEESGDYRLLANKPVLNTKNSESLEGKTELIENVVQLHRVSKTGKYDDLLYKPVLDSSSFISLEPSDSELIDQVIRLHRIAKTGNYNDLVGAPDVDQLIQDLEAHLRTRAGEFLGHARTGEDLVFTDEGMGRIKDNVLLRGLPTIEGELPVSDNSSRIASTAFVQNLVTGIEVLEGVDSVHTDSGTTLSLHNGLEYEELVRLSGGKLSVYATDGKELLKDDGNRLGLGDLSRSVDIAGRELLMNVPGSWGVSTCTASLYYDAFRICSNGISVECNNIGIQANDTLGVRTNDLRVQARNLTEESDSADVQSNNYFVSSVSFRQESTEFDQESVRMNVHTETFYLNTNTFRISNWPVDNSSRTTIDCWEPVYVGKPYSGKCF